MACSSASTVAIGEKKKKEQRLIDAMFLCDEWKSSKGGLSTFNRELAINLAETTTGSMKIHCYVSRSDDQDREDAKQHGVNLITAQTVPGSGDPPDWLKIIPPELPHPHIVIGHGRKFGIPAFHVERATRCKWIQFVHVFCEDLGKFKETTATTVADTIEENEEKHKKEIELCKAADAVVAVGSRLQQKYSRSLPNVKVEIIIPGIMGKFCNESIESGEHAGVLSRTSNDMFMKTFNVFMFGRATFEDLTLKGYDIVANAIGSLGVKFELTFVGSSPGDHRNVEQWFLRKACIKRKQLTIRGYCTEQDELKGMFHQSDLVALPSRTEGFGLVGLEAISCGVPVLVSGESGLAEALQKVQGGSNVIVQSDDDADEWARRISEVSSQSPEQRQTNARELRENYRKVYPWRMECERFKGLIENVVKTANGGEMNVKVDVDELKPEEQNMQASMLATESVRCQEVQQPRASATSAASGGVSCPQTEDLNARKEETFLSIIINYFQATKPQSIEEFDRFKEYAKEMRFIITGVSEGSLVITVKCESLMILEELWTDYTSGHLGEVVQSCFVTEKILKELNLVELKLKTTMDIEEYNACKMCFEKDALRGALSSEFHSTSSTRESPQKKEQSGKSEQKTKIMETAKLEGTSPVMVVPTTGHGKELEEPCGRKDMFPLLVSSTSDPEEELEPGELRVKLPRLKGKDNDGNQTAEVMIASLNIALRVALFLLNTDRIQKAIEMCSECLILLSNTDQNSKDQFDSLLLQFYSAIYTVLFSACRISDCTSAERYGRKLLVLYSESGDLVKEGDVSMVLAEMSHKIGENLKAKEYIEKALAIKTEIGDRRGEASCYGNLGKLLQSLGECDKAMEYLQKALVISIEIGDRKLEANEYGNLATVFQSLWQYDKAKECLQKALVIRTETSDREGEANEYGNLSTLFQSLGHYDKAEEYLKKALAITTEIGDREGKASWYGNLSTVFQSLGQFDKAKEYLQKALVISADIGDKKEEASCYENLATVSHSLAQYEKAKEYLQKALVISTEIGDRQGEASCYENQATVFHSLGQYEKAKEYLQKALFITTEIGDRKGQASCYEDLRTPCQSHGQYDKAKEYLQEALFITIEIGDRIGEAPCYENLATVFHSLGQYETAKECLQKALFITTEIGDRKGEASCYGNLGTTFQSLGQYDKAKDYLQKALIITTEIGDRKGEASWYGNLGTVFQSLGQYDKAKEYFYKALIITTEIGDRKGEASWNGNLGTVFQSLGQYDKAKVYFQKALIITTEIGDREGEALWYGNLGTVFQSLGQYDMAKEYLKEALVISTKIGNKVGKAADLANLGILFSTVGDYEASEVCLEKALSISRDVGDRRKEIQILLGYAILYLFQKKIKDSLSCLYLCIEKQEELRYFIGANDQLKTSFLEDSGICPNKLLCTLLCYTGNARDALYVEELGRARGLSDLMAEKYSVQTHISAKPQSWFDIENVFRTRNNCSCLYISYFRNYLHLWILKTSGVLHYKRISVEENLLQAGWRRGILPTEGFVNSSLSLCYKMLIAPVFDLLEEPEVIIVPDGSLYRVPFAALSEKEGGGYLSETHRIRVIPSLTTLKIIQDASAGDYHSVTGALIIGNPKIDWLPPLPGARREAEMVGRLVGVPPLVEEKATKMAVLERISSASLVHFAAHSNAERGEIALSPIPIPRQNAFPPKETYMLTMSDVSRMKIRAQLVVLSCCHTGSGQRRAEGVIGIASAFLGSGARSVLVALWDIPDLATQQLMCQFYGHLVEGESASESLHQAMKWMRNNGSTEVSEWASFTLIGDDVRLEFDKQRSRTGP